MSGREDMDQTQPLTVLLDSATAGDAAARRRLWTLVYDELHALAAACLAGERNAPSLQPTALVHEAFLRIAGGTSLRFTDRRHFFALAARVMRQLLIDHARARRRQKRNFGRPPLPLDGEGPAVSPPHPIGYLALEEALEALDRSHPRRARIAELRFLAGMTIREVADALGVSPRTVVLESRIVRAWLYRFLATHTLPCSQNGHPGNARTRPDHAGGKERSPDGP